MESENIGSRKKNSKLDDDKLVFETSEDIKVYSSFDQMGLNEKLLRGIHGYSFDKPSAVQ